MKKTNKNTSYNQPGLFLFRMCEAIHNDQSTNTPHVRYPHEKQSLNNPNKQFFAPTFPLFPCSKKFLPEVIAIPGIVGGAWCFFLGGGKADAWSENWPWFTWRWTPWKRRYLLESITFTFHTVDGSEIRLTSWYVVYLIIYRISYISGGAGFLPSTVVVFRGVLNMCSCLCLGKMTQPR